MPKPKLIRITTVPISLNKLLEGQLRFMKDYYEVLAVSAGPVTELEEVGVREGVPTKLVAMTRSITPLQDLKAVWQLYKLFKKERPAIVHSITPKAGLLAMIAAKMAGVPIRMHTFTGLIFPTKTDAMQQLLIFMDKLLCWAATHVYPEGEGVKNDLENYRITSKPMQVLANGNVNGIDTSHFNSANFSEQYLQDVKLSAGIHPNDFVFVFVGRLVGDKGINELVSAFSRHSDRFGLDRHSERSEGISPRIPKLLLVGPFESELDPLQPQTLQEIKNNPNIITVGFQKDVRPYLAISHALAFPSYREGFPNVVMQAGAMGLPAIVTDINGCNEIIEDGKNGLIIPFKNTNALYEKMKLLLTATALYDQLKKNARPMICERYEQKVVWEALLSEYNSLLAQYNSTKG